MLGLIGTDALVALVFASLYAGAGTRWMTQGAFLAGLVVFFVASIALWVRVEQTGSAGRDVITRIGRGSFALVVIVVGLPALVLAPLVGLQASLPPASGFADVVRPAMVLLLISLLWTVAVNMVGGIVLAGVGLWTALARRSRSGP
jgi:hypothetical protein